MLRALPLLEEVNEGTGGEADPGAGKGSSDGPDDLGRTGGSDSPGRSDDLDPYDLPTGSAAPITFAPTGIPEVRHTPFTPTPEDRLGDLTLSLVREALRGNDNSVIEAALGAYAAARLPDAEYRQAVLKCAFSDIPLDRLYGLDARADRELARMLADFAHERIAAGRTVPADVWPLVRAHTALAKSVAARARDLAGTCPEAAA
ncbi:EboA domain-containing protein, partial [Streptomyces sp. S6]